MKIQKSCTLKIRGGRARLLRQESRKGSVDSMGEVGDIRGEPRPNADRLLWNGKADGASGGGIAYSVTGDHDNRPTDMTNIVIEHDKRESACLK